MISVKSTVSKIIFYNENSGYAVIILENNTTAAGTIPKIQLGEEVELSGNWYEHPKYGKQFKFESFKIKYPASENDLMKFLSSGVIKGIRGKLAERIINTFKDKTLNILENDLDKLAKVKGVGRKKAEAINTAWKEKKNLIDLGMFLSSHGIPLSYGIKIEKIYGNESLSIIKSNPYKLINDIWGIGFKKADAIASKIGFSEHHPQRIKSGIIYILNEAAGNGHVYLPLTDLISECLMLLKFELSFHDKILLELEAENEITVIDDKVYLTDLYLYERGIENSLKRVDSSKLNEIKLSKDELKSLQINFSDEQIDAIVSSLKHKVLIITGGPGTGKTETLKGIINVFENNGKKILLAAPTGRAAKRMTDVIGKESKTIHRLLEYNPILEIFNRDSDNKLEADLVIIDEVSMIDTSLMFHLLEAIDDGTSLLLVGDVNQLPSVGPGNNLKDIIESELFTVVTLTKIFRQSEQSEIIFAAHRILNGDSSMVSASYEKDFMFIEENDENKIPEIILRLCAFSLYKDRGFDPLNDLQVISPMHKGINGTENLNKVLQQGLNDNRTLLKYGHFEYKIGDKIMQLVNNYEKDIYNGDWGFLKSAVKDKTFFIQFNNREVAFKKEDFDKLTLSYAITVHKSQGSEYPCVILPLVTSHFIMLQRNLLYTAVTRAKELLIIVGSRKAFYTAINKNRIVHRYTSLFKDSREVRKYVPFDS